MRRVVLLIAALATSGAIAASAGASASARPLSTAVVDPLAADPTSPAEYQRIRATGATLVRLILRWSAVAPAARPVAFSPTDPADPAYRWDALDAEVRAAIAAGLEPILDFVGAPGWALEPGTKGADGGPGTPIAADLGAFAQAAATRYRGSFRGLPRVRYWEVWNEPNLTPYLSPQLVDGKPVAPIAYRGMVNSVADAVKGVHLDNVVVAGGLAPFYDKTPSVVAQDKDNWGPLAFMRAFFCLSSKLKPVCHTTARFDVWSHHPYTSGGPTHHAALPNDVSLPDLPKLDAVLRAALAAGDIVPHRLPQLWVTEFSWDSNPPDPNGVPTALLKRWVPQALYEMWRERVSLVTWFTLDDQALSAGPYQSGLHYANGRAKPYLEGFRFPVVAFPRAHGFYVWGRTPAGSPGAVVVQRRTGGGWRRVATLRANAAGIFQKTFRGARTGWVRARLVAGGETSLAFSLASVPDRTYVPFGLGKPLEP
jgi:hypothetical protein